MERYKSFTVDRERFPHFEKLTAELKGDGIHLVPIIDAGLKVEPGYDVYEEGVAENRFCKNAAGEDFTLGVWPGHCHLARRHGPRQPPLVWRPVPKAPRPRDRRLLERYERALNLLYRGTV